MTGSTGEVMAQHMYNAMQEFDCLESIRAILVDNTSVNTGWKNGLVVKFEDKLGQNLHTFGCALHQNELPFRATFKKLDGVTTGTQSFSGPLGKKVKRTSTVNHKLLLSLLKTIYNIASKRRFQ